MNSTQEAFILHLSEFLPDRKPGKRGTKPIDKITLLTELFKLAKFNLGWRNIQYSSTCRNYLYEIQRRGKFKNFFNFLVKDFKKFRPKKTITDSSDIVSYNTNSLVSYSGKYHNYCIKFSVRITPEYIPLEFSLDYGSRPDSKIYDDIIAGTDKLPYCENLDKGYENYDRRRNLEKQNCRLVIEMKRSGKNRKQGPRFKCMNQDKIIRSEIDKLDESIYDIKVKQVKD